ncbi:hypothetical protein [Roseicitreum antarcticum]|uniref:Uncharacterized protein n=1 Tax=Roseicitreum antarcticum TaxID=564137 RepID=A0A1H3DXW5_9RHOB|nr:hypothetical protein [Roseicitreum antarcticum]SDX71160.1 hypothetical protein SAMN04488238_11648 [Roseicitreum antarcticum]
MLKPETELSINRLSDALRTSFEWIVKRDREVAIGDIAEAWAELTASALQDVQLMAPPIVDHTEPFLPFIETHKIRTDLFRVALSGMRGGPRLDLIFQVWFDTEDASGGFGVPLIMQKIPSAGLMPDLVWNDLREAAKKLNAATPSGRIVLFGDGSDFDWGETRISRFNPIMVMNAHTFASIQASPHPVSGRLHYHFCDDLASGWIGDPALSGRENSPVLDEILSNFHVGHVLRISIFKQGK